MNYLPFLSILSNSLICCRSTCPTKYLRVGRHPAAVQVLGLILSVSLTLPLLSLKLLRRIPGSFYSIQSDATVGREGGSASAVYPSLTNSGAFVSGKVSQIPWCLRIARNGIWILGIPGAACLRRLCHFSDVFVGSRNRLLWLVYQMIILWVLSGAGRNYNP